MTSATIEHTYNYLFESQWRDSPTGGELAFATSAGTTHPYFFQGQLTHPQRAAQLLLVCGRVARARFYDPGLKRRLLMLDPVVTGHADAMRFESFSACNSVYARADFYPHALDGEFLSAGTTNVDFHQPMRAALARIRPRQAVELAVGKDEVAITAGGQKTVERKVPLPVRWLRGFVEVQAIQARMTPAFRLPTIEARRFILSLPRSKQTTPSWIVQTGKHWRISQRQTPDAVQVGGLERLGLFRDVVNQLEELVLYTEPEGATGWQLRFPEASLFLVLSATPKRGFSGEGQALEALASDWDDDIVTQVAETLKWQYAIDASTIERAQVLSTPQVQTALAILGSRGLVGYDLNESAYFHRELPFDLGKVENLHPRLKSARGLYAGHSVALVSTQADADVFHVTSGENLYQVRKTPTETRCTCRWYARYQGARGVCKHVLAVQLFIAEKS